MPAPIIRQLVPDTSRPARVIRDIDNHYHLEMVAENSRQLVEYQKQSFRLKQAAAINNIRAMGEIAQRQDQSNSLLFTLSGGIDRLNDGTDALQETARETLNTLNTQTQVLQEGFEYIAAAWQEGFEDIAERMMQQRRVLEQIADILRRPYGAKALELLKEADHALKNGMKASGRDQEEEFKDAARLLRDVLDNPIGSRNYVAWFQTGWLNWKFESKLPEAEESFYQAARLSRAKADLYHTFSLQHLAYMQYLQRRPAEAYDTIHKALRVTPNDHDILYAAARYAAKTGRESEAFELLEKCIDLQPQTTITMFSEEDFVSMSAIMQEGLASLLFRRTEAGRAKALSSIKAWLHIISAVRQTESMADCKINLPIEQIHGVQQAAEAVDTANYVLAVHLANQAAFKREAAQTTAIKVLQEEIKHLDNEQSEAAHSIQTAMREREVSLNEAKNEAEMYRESIFRSTPRFEHPREIITDWMENSLGVTVLVFLALVIDITLARAFTDNGGFRVILMFVFAVPSLIIVFEFNAWLYEARVKAYITGVKSKQRSQISVTDAALERTIKNIEMRLQEQKDVIENRIRLIDAQKQKLEKALQWLKAEFEG